MADPNPAQPKSNGRLVALIGAGPAGLYGAGKLAEAGHTVVLFNRDLKPGGLAEYGIYPNKHKMKEGIRRQFRKILADPNVHFLGGVTVGERGVLTLDEIRALGFDAIVVAAGAQGTKSLGLPGEEARGVYHAKDLVYHYNQLPPFSLHRFELGRAIAIIGVGNVMVDVAHYAINAKQVDRVIAVARRGPAERAYSDLEMKLIAAAIDQKALREELERIRPRLEAVGQNPDEIFQDLVKDCHRPLKDGPSPTRLLFRFLSQPRRILADAEGRVRALEVEETELVAKGESLSARGTGTIAEIPCDTVVFAVGDQVDPALGLPFDRGSYVTNPHPHPDDPTAHLYEVYDPRTETVLSGHFVIGWSRKASDGLVGKARQDGERGVQVVLRYLEGLPAPAEPTVEARLARLRELLAAKKGAAVVDKEAWQLLEAAEREQAERLGVEVFKYDDDREMIAAIEQMRSRAAVSSGKED